MLTGLRHRTISGRANQDSAIHLSSTGNHVFYIVGVTRAVNVRIVTNVRVILDVRSIDGDATCFFFRGAVDLVEVNLGRTENLGANASQRGGQRRLTMVNVTNGADVHVRLVTFELFLSHRDCPPVEVISRSNRPLKQRQIFSYLPCHMELLSGFEPLTSPLPRVCSTN